MGSSARPSCILSPDNVQSQRPEDEQREPRSAALWSSTATRVHWSPLVTRQVAPRDVRPAEDMPRDNTDLGCRHRRGATQSDAACQVRCCARRNSIDCSESEASARPAFVLSVELVSDNTGQTQQRPSGLRRRILATAAMSAKRLTIGYAARQTTRNGTPRDFGRIPLGHRTRVGTVGIRGSGPPGSAAARPKRTSS
jgi:hypothetical protein